MTIEVVGIVAGTFTTFAFLPQVIKVIRTKDTRSLSLPMYLIYLMGVVSWIAYGILQNDLIITLSNVGSLILALLVVGYKIAYK